MTTTNPNDQAKCFACDKEKIVYLCGGCSKKFCFKDLGVHRQNLGKQFDVLENECDEIHQILTEQKSGEKSFPLTQEVDKWEEDSIKKIKQTAEICRNIILQYKSKHFTDVANRLTDLTDQMTRIRREDEFNEITLDQLKTRLTKLADELDHPQIIKLQTESVSFINKISVFVSAKIHQPTEVSEATSLSEFDAPGTHKLYEEYLFSL